MVVNLVNGRGTVSFSFNSTYTLVKLKKYIIVAFGWTVETKFSITALHQNLDQLFLMDSDESVKNFFSNNFLVYYIDLVLEYSKAITGKKKGRGWSIN